MAYTAPTAADLKARFPAFASVADATIDIALGDAALMVDDSWDSQEDFTLGRLLYAAHVLALDGHGDSEAALGAYKTIRSGRLTLDRGSGQAVQSGSLGATTYGVRFRELLHRNRSGPVLAKSS